MYQWGYLELCLWLFPGVQDGPQVQASHRHNSIQGRERGRFQRGKPAFQTPSLCPGTSPWSILGPCPLLNLSSAGGQEASWSTQTNQDLPPSFVKEEWTPEQNRFGQKREGWWLFAGPELCLVLTMLIRMQTPGATDWTGLSWVVEPCTWHEPLRFLWWGCPQIPLWETLFSEVWKHIPAFLLPRSSNNFHFSPAPHPILLKKVFKKWRKERKDRGGNKGGRWERDHDFLCFSPVPLHNSTMSLQGSYIALPISQKWRLRLRILATLPKIKWKWIQTQVLDLHLELQPADPSPYRTPEDGQALRHRTSGFNANKLG